MIFKDLSGSKDVGSTCSYIELGPFRLVIDSGFHPQKTGFETLPQFDLIENYSIDYIILTHCHLDHLGSLPVLFRKNPNARILSSIPSMRLAPRMLWNSYKIMLKQREELNIQEYPLFAPTDIEKVEKAFLPMVYKEARVFEKSGESLQIIFYSSGHIPGASGCLLNYKHRKIFFTGDVLFEDQKIIDGAKFPEEIVDTLIIETTRGNTEIPESFSRQTEADRLIEFVNHTLSRGGSCLIPAFALGRMQEILAIIHEAYHHNKLKKSPIFCSGLGLDLVDYFDEICRKTQLIRFRKRILKEIKAKALRANLRPGKGVEEPGLYILSSGMLVEKTPSYALASCILDDPQSSICFVGYCDPKTPGGKLLATPHEEPFTFEALDYVASVRASIEKFDLSGHSNRETLIKFAIQKDPRAIILTHGETEAREWFESTLYSELGKTKIINPDPGIEYLV